MPSKKNPKSTNLEDEKAIVTINKISDSTSYNIFSTRASHAVPLIASQKQLIPPGAQITNTGTRTFIDQVWKIKNDDPTLKTLPQESQMMLLNAKSHFQKYFAKENKLNRTTEMADQLFNEFLPHYAAFVISLIQHIIKEPTGTRLFTFVNKPTLAPTTLEIINNIDNNPKSTKITETIAIKPATEEEEQQTLETKDSSQMEEQQQQSKEKQTQEEQSEQSEQPAQSEQPQQQQDNLNSQKTEHKSKESKKQSGNQKSNKRKSKNTPPTTTPPLKKSKRNTK